MDEPTVPHIDTHQEGPWLPPGLSRDNPSVEVPDLRYWVRWNPERAPEGWLGRGGMGHAWLGEHADSHDHVVLKFFDPLPPDSTQKVDWPVLLQALRDLFGKEARVKLGGNHLIDSKHYLLCPRADWRPVLVMERASCSVADILAHLQKTRASLPLALIRQLMYDSALGLHRLHDIHKLLHDDVKPGNLFVRLLGGRAYDGLSSLEVKSPEDDRRYHLEGAVGDFGVIGKLQDPRAFLFGQDGFKAPEQLRAREAADPRTDLFGLGRTLWHLLQFSRDPVPRWMTELVEQCTHQNVGQRPVSAEAVAWALSSKRDRFRCFNVEPELHAPFVERRAASRVFDCFRSDPQLRILHVKGDPGTGKTALLSHWAMDVAPGAGYFLSCLGDASLRQALLELLKSLIDTFGRPEDRDLLPTQLNARAVRSILEELLSRPNSPVPAGEPFLLYIDALDEADNPADVESYLPVEGLKRVKLIVSSRHEPRFESLESAKQRLELSLDADEYRQSNREEAEDFSHRRLADLRVPHELCAEVARALGANFQLVQIYCNELKRRDEQGELDLAAVRYELAELSGAFGRGAAGEDQFHQFYRTNVWCPAFRLVEQDFARSELFVRLAGLLAAAEAPVPVRVLRNITGRENDGVVESLLGPLRRSLRRELVRGAGGHLPAYRYAHKTLQTFITSKYGPVNDPEQLANYRQLILDYYAGQPTIASWDHFGLGSVIRLWLRQGRPDEACAWLTKHEFIETVTKAREPGLGVDGLREMFQHVREAAGIGQH